MRAIFIICLAAACACYADDLTTLDKKIFRDVVVRKMDPDGIVITHATGGSKVAFTNLSPELQKKFGYDPAKVVAATSPQKKNAGSGRLGLVYRLDKLEEAKSQARREGKPLAFIAAEPGWLEINQDYRNGGSHAATVHAYEVLKAAAVVVFVDCREENHQEPPVVDAALHAPDDPDRIPPKVVIVDADVEKVIGVVLYNRDVVVRQRLLLEQLAKIKAARK